MSVILATAGFDHEIFFWEAPSGINSRTLRCGESPVNCLEITPNKQFLAAGGNPQIRLFEISDHANPNPVLVLSGHTAAVTSIGFQKEVRFLYSGSEDGTAKLWDLRSPNPSANMDCKSGVNSVALHPSRNEIVTGDQNGAIKVWDTRSLTNPLPKLLNEIIPTDSKTTNSVSFQERQGVSIQSVDISKDGRTIMAATNQAEVFLWDYTDPTCFTPLSNFQAHPMGTYLTRAKISPDSRQLVTCSSDQTARLFNIYRPPDTPIEEKYNLEAKPSLILNQHNKWVWDAVFSADSSYLVTASSDKKARLFNLRTGEVVKTYTGHQLTVTCVALNDSST